VTPSYLIFGANSKNHSFRHTGMDFIPGCSIPTVA